MAAEESSPAATEARKQAVDRFMASLAGEMSKAEPTTNQAHPGGGQPASHNSSPPWTNTADSGEIMVMAAEKKRGHY